MNLFRFTSERYKDDLSGNGARLFGGRWNSKGLAAIYTSETVSLSLLEIFAHAVQYDDLKEKFLMTLSAPDDISIYKIPFSKLRSSWQNDIAYTRFIGDAFLRDNKYLLLQAPSAIIKTEFNFMVNPGHKDFKKIKLVSSELFDFDSRIFKPEE
jgi:RES domain-containing protein